MSAKSVIPHLRLVRGPERLPLPCPVLASPDPSDSVKRSCAPEGCSPRVPTGWAILGCCEVTGVCCTVAIILGSLAVSGLYNSAGKQAEKSTCPFGPRGPICELLRSPENQGCGLTGVLASCPSAPPTQTSRGQHSLNVRGVKDVGSTRGSPSGTPLGLLPLGRTGSGGPTGQLSLRPLLAGRGAQIPPPPPRVLHCVLCAPRVVLFLQLLSFLTALLEPKESPVSTSWALTLGSRSEGWAALTVGLGCPACNSGCSSFTSSTGSSSKGLGHFSRSLSNHAWICTGKEDFTFTRVKESGSEAVEEEGGVRCRPGLAGAFRHSFS